MQKDSYENIRRLLRTMMLTPVHCDTCKGKTYFTLREDDSIACTACGNEPDFE